MVRRVVYQVRRCREISEPRKRKSLSIHPYCARVGLTGAEGSSGSASRPRPGPFLKALLRNSPYGFPPS